MSSEACVQDETKVPKVSTKNILNFEAWAYISMYITAEMYKFVKENAEWVKLNWWNTFHWDQTIQWDLIINWKNVTSNWQDFIPNIRVEWWNKKNNFEMVHKTWKYKIIWKTLFIQFNIYIERKWEPNWVLVCDIPEWFSTNWISEMPLEWFICKRWENPAIQNRGQTVAQGNRILILIWVDTNVWTIDWDDYVWRVNWVIPIS